MRRLNLQGHRFGRLIAVSEIPERTRGKKILWLCRCDCGDEVRAASSDLRSGLTKSCGCMRRENLRSRTHGMSKTPEYEVWLGMKQRCTNPNHVSFPYYGARGIEVCERWMSSFEYFSEDMGPRPPGTSIEREDNDGPYAPWNCKWATRKEQDENKRHRRHEAPNSRSLSSSNTVGFKGVTRKRGRFIAQIRFQGRRWHIGSFDTPEEAHQAYLDEANKLQRHFAPVLTGGDQ